MNWDPRSLNVADPWIGVQGT